MLRFFLVENWALTLFVLLGLAAVYLLLPRPRRYPVLPGAALGGAALLLAGYTLVRTDVVSPESILFYGFSAIAVIAGVMLLAQSNPAHAALSFALVVLSTCGLFLLLAAPFLMAATTIVYAGAIIVTFLFVLMLAHQTERSDADYRSREPFLSALAGFLLLGALLYVLNATYDTGDLDRLLARTEQVRGRIDRASGGPAPQSEQGVLDEVRDLAREYQAAAQHHTSQPESKQLSAEAENVQVETDLKEIRGYLDRMQALVLDLRDSIGGLRPPRENESLSAFSGPRPNEPDARRDRSGRPAMPAENVAYLGRSLFTDFLLAVELGGVLLLVATIGAIAITGRRPGRAS